MTIILALREARGNTILWAYRGPSVPVYAMAGSAVPSIIYYRNKRITIHLNRRLIIKYDVIKCFFASKCIHLPIYYTKCLFVADQLTIL